MPTIRRQSWRSLTLLQVEWTMALTDCIRFNPLSQVVHSPSVTGRSARCPNDPMVILFRTGLEVAAGWKTTKPNATNIHNELHILILY